MDIDIPDKAYDSWGTLIYDAVNVQKGTLYTLKKYDFISDPALSAFLHGRLMALCD